MQSGSTPNAPDKFAGIQAPTQDDLSYQIQQLVDQGVISPQDAKTALAGRSELDNVSTDPKLQAAQMDALSQLQDIGQSGGMTLNDKANLNQIATDEATQSKGARDAIIQNAASRGLGGSGLDLMAQLQNEQSAASDKSQRDLSVAGTAQARALQALQDAGTQAGSIQNQQFNQQAQKAAANDAISKFNAQNQNSMNLANTQTQNQAQAANLANKQGIANTNATLQTQQNAQKSQNAQQMFNNSIAKAGGQQSVANQNAAAQGQNSQSAAAANNQLLGSAIGAGASIYGAQSRADGGMIGGPPTDFDSQPVVAQPGEVVIKKDDVPHLLQKAHTDKHGKFDAAAFLDTITGHKYNYSKKKRGA